MISMWSAPDEAKSSSIRAITSSSASPRMELMVNVMSLAFSTIAVSLLRTGASESAGEKALTRPPKISPGSIRINSTGSKSRMIMTAMILPMCLRPAQTAPATAPYGPPAAAPFAAPEIALPALMAPFIVWAADAPVSTASARPVFFSSSI